MPRILKKAARFEQPFFYHISSLVIIFPSHFCTDSNTSKKEFLL